MCRFFAYMGRPIIADELLLKPSNSLIKQSYRAKETSMPVNGDGFGLGWYNHRIRPEPALYHSINPAWNDHNLHYNAPMIKSSCIMAHIRAATQGGVSIENTHPFRFKEFLMMQNGGIKDFVKIKRLVIDRLDDESFEWITGQTDTQYIFALFMTIVKETRMANNMDSGENREYLEAEDLVSCFTKTFELIEEMKETKDLESPSLYNLVLTDGHRLIATRYSTKPEQESRSLHLASNADCYLCDKGFLRFRDATDTSKAVLISSEVLSEERAYWSEVPENHCIIVDEKLNVQIRSME